MVLVVLGAVAVFASSLLKDAVLAERGYWAPKLARFLMRLAGRLAPSRSEEWLAELDALQLNDPPVPGVTFALGVLCSAPLTGLLTRMRSRRHQDPYSTTLQTHGAVLAVAGRTSAAVVTGAAIALITAIIFSTSLAELAPRGAKDGARMAVTSYDRMAPGAPHWGFTIHAWQDFKAASNTITKLGVRWGNLNMPNGSVAGMSTHVVLCASQPTSPGGCSDPVVAGDAAFVNYGASVVDVGDVAVTPGQTYWLFYVSPTPVWSTWDVFWWDGPGAGRGDVNASQTMQAEVLGYNR
jgi:hypothetical protein